MNISWRHILWTVLLLGFIASLCAYAFILGTERGIDIAYREMMNSGIISYQ